MGILCDPGAEVLVSSQVSERPKLVVAWLAKLHQRGRYRSGCTRELAQWSGTAPELTRHARSWRMPALAGDRKDCVCDVHELHPVAGTRLRRVGIEFEAEPALLIAERVAARGRGARHARNRDSVLVLELHRAVIRELEGVAAFVHEAVVAAAQRDEVVEARLAASAPV